MPAWPRQSHCAVQPPPVPPAPLPPPAGGLPSLRAGIRQLLQFSQPQTNPLRRPLIKLWASGHAELGTDCFCAAAHNDMLGPQCKSVATSLACVAGPPSTNPLP